MNRSPKKCIAEKQEKLLRLNLANQVIETIATNGRKHLSHKDRIGRLDLDERGRIWYIDPYSQKRIYTHYEYEWRGFNGGGTLRSLIKCLRKYVCSGDKLSIYALGYRPDWYCGGDIFGYGNDILKVWKIAKPLLQDKSAEFVDSKAIDSQEGDNAT